MPSFHITKEKTELKTARLKWSVCNGNNSSNVNDLIPVHSKSIVPSDIEELMAQIRQVHEMVHKQIEVSNASESKLWIESARRLFIRRERLERLAAGT